MRVHNAVLAVLAFCLCLAPASSEAQLGALKKVKKKTEKKIEQKAERKVDDKIDEEIDKAMEGSSESEESADESPSKQESAPATNGASSTSSTGGAGGHSASAKLKPGEGAWANYDFVPGDQVLFYDDFSKTPTGDFPQRLEFISGNLEVVEWQGGKYLRSPTHADFDIPLPKTLPTRFTIEFDLFLGSQILYVYCPAPDGSRYDKHSYVELRSYGSGVKGSGGGEAVTSLLKEKTFDDLVKCRIMGDGKYLKVYINEVRVANVPNTDFVRTNKIRISAWNPNAEQVLFGEFRVAEGGKKILYDQLQAEGRVATRGIYFDTGSDRLRPESTPTLKEMAAMLKEHTDLKLLIEGHTDDVGDDAYNLDLSERRAASVRSYLVAEYGIDGSRLQSKGLGETKPAGPNTSPEGRQFNRRVELVKL